MAATLDEIIGYLSEENNEAELRKMLLNAAGAEAKSISAGKIANKRRLEEIFAEAKKDADDFFSISPNLANPSLESYGLFQLAGILIANVGIKGLAKELFKIYSNESDTCYGVYMPLIDTILCCRGRENWLYLAMAHEYSHAVYYKLLNKLCDGLEYKAFEEGFATAASNALMRRKDENKRRMALRKEKYMLENGLRALHDDKFQKRIKWFSDNKREIGHNDKIAIYGIGYCLFRLAEERHGQKVYKDVLNNDDGALFEQAKWQKNKTTGSSQA